jgi:glutamine synthetase
MHCQYLWTRFRGGAALFAANSPEYVVLLPIRRRNALECLDVDRSGDEWERRRAELVGRGVRYCLAGFVDVHGTGKAKAVPIEHFGRMMGGSELFTGAALDGLGQDPSDDELAVLPELDAITVLPWEPSVAWAPGFLHLDGRRWPMCSRTVLARQVGRAAARGLRFDLGIETEFFLVRREGGRLRPANPDDTLAKAAYDVIGLLENLPFMDQLTRFANQLGWDVFSYDHEDANGQFELDFSYTDGMAMADRMVLLRMMLRVLARRAGCEVTFMPKPFGDRTGTGAHFNMSLAELDGGRNVFADPDDPRGCGLSRIGYAFVAGILRHAPAITAVCAATVNSYKRLVKTGSMTGSTWAPVSISYGRNNRTHMIRLPSTSARVECRAVDPCCNPYLAAAMFLAAGMEGVEADLDPGDPLDRNMYELTGDQLRELGVGTLPRTLLEAVEAFDRDPLADEVMGAELKAAYVDLKQREWWEYHDTVSDWEIDRYLTLT